MGGIGIILSSDVSIFLRCISIGLDTSIFQASSGYNDRSPIDNSKFTQALHYVLLVQWNNIL